MAEINCTYSGLRIKVPHVPMTTAWGECAHPIFYLPQKKLLGLYSTYRKGELTETDSFLLFLALLNSTDNVKWRTSARYTTSTPAIIANNIGQLVSVIWETNSITAKGFRQPRYIVNSETSTLDVIPNWIKSWKDNIASFRSNYREEHAMEELKKVENKLSYIIKAGTKDANYSNAVANWAAKAGSFPPDIAEDWKGIIRKCFNSSAMFSTPKATLLAIRTYCENNIEVGSIHFHALMETLNEGINRHTDFLGLWDITPHSPEEQKVAAAKQAAAILEVVSNAPTSEPSRLDYSSEIAYLRAKLAYRAANIEATKNPEELGL